MPFYEYRCQECGHQFDVLQKVSDESLRDCPECLKPALVKLVSAPSFRLAGSGWYETDFKTDKDKKKNLADSKGNSGEKKTGTDTAGKQAASLGGAQSKADKPRSPAA